MAGKQLNREEAWELLCRYNESDALRRHGVMVETVMRHYASKLGEDPDKWGVIGLLHDVDYERYPDQHCAKAEEILRDAGADDATIHGVVSHGWGICSDVEPVETMEKILFATDELTGLIHAAAIMRPSKSVLDLELKSVRKKYKTQSFAAGVDRGIIEKGAGMLGVTVEELITECIAALRGNADAVGLRGTL